MFNDPTRPHPADLWRDGVQLRAYEFRGLFEECSFGWTIEPAKDSEGLPVWYLRQPCGDRYQDGYPWESWADLVCDLTDWINQGLAEGACQA